MNLKMAERHCEAALRARRPEILHRTPNRNGGGSAYCRLGKLLDILVCEEMSWPRAST